MATIKIGLTADALTEITEPSALGITLQDIDSASTTRMADGSMTRDRVVGGADAKRKLEIKYNTLYSQALSDVLRAVEAEFFFVEYPDPYTGGRRTAEFYCGDRGVQMYNAVLHNGEPIWQDLSFNLIER